MKCVSLWRGPYRHNEDGSIEFMPMDSMFVDSLALCLTLPVVPSKESPYLPTQVSTFAHRLFSLIAKPLYSVGTPSSLVHSFIFISSYLSSALWDSFIHFPPIYLLLVRTPPPLFHSFSYLSIYLLLASQYPFAFSFIFLFELSSIC